MGTGNSNYKIFPPPVTQNTFEEQKMNINKCSKENKKKFEKTLMSCNSDDSNLLPLINIKFTSVQKTALLDTGANISLIQASTLEKIKQSTKVEYISRSVKIRTIDNSSIPYLSAVNLKFKISNKWFSNVFFVTKNEWNSNYEIILGYDFIQKNKILIDSANNCLIIDNTKLSFLNQNFETISNNIECIKEVNVNSVRASHNVDIEPGKSKIVSVSVHSSFTGVDPFIFIPNVKLKCTIQNSLHDKTTNNKFITIIENTSNKKIRIRKKTKIGVIQNFHEEDIVEPDDKEVYQVNAINLEKIKLMRKEELNPNQFKLDHLNGKDKEKILQLLNNNFAVFSSSYNTLGSTDQVTPEFKLYHDYALQTKPYPIPKIAKEYAQQEIKSLLDAGIIEPSSSNYCFPVIFVKKKSLPGEDNKQKFRMVVDYRLLNSITESHKICLPKITDIIQNISGKTWYSVLDLKSAFFQICLQDKDKEKLAFCCELGNFQPRRLPFGAKNSTAYFHTLISKCLNDIKGSNIQFFLDDIIVAAETIEEMIELLQKIFERLEKFNLTLDPAKMQICKNKITYLGFQLDKNGYSPSEENVKKVSKFPIPKTVKEVQSYLGMLNYFRHLIFNFAELAQPIVNLTRKNSEFIWDQNCQNAFNKFQDIMLLKPTLKNIKQNEKLYLITDASKIAVCGILMQKHEDKFYPIEFFSKQLNPAETRYPSIRRELYAIFLAVKHFSEHLYGREFSILTDAKPLTHHIHLDKQPDIVARWLLYLQSFSYDIEHVPGFSNPADFLSRVCEEVDVNNIKIFSTSNDLNYDNIVIHQRNDDELKKIINAITENKNAKKNYYIDENSGLLMKKIKPKAKHLRNKKIENKIVTPKSLIKSCIENAHGPHFGAVKTFDFIKKRYYWNNYFLDTKNFCENCHVCMQNKSKPCNTEFDMISKSHLAPGQFLAIDIVGKLPRSHDGKFFILTIIDHYSRFLEAIPLHNINSSTVIKALNNYFARFGIPKILLSDNGTNFGSGEMETFLSDLKIEHRKTSIYFPRSNGTLERIHKLLKESLAALSHQTYEWSDRILFFKLNYNNSVHSVTKFSPAQLFFGRDLITPMDVNHPVITAHSPNTQVAKNKKLIQETRQMVEQNEKDYFAKQEKFIKGRKKQNLKIDNIVYVKAFTPPGTFEPKYNGPYKILRVLRNNNYVIQDLNDNNAKTKKVNSSKLWVKKPTRRNLLSNQ